MIEAPPAYVPAPGRQALIQRLRALVDAEAPVACGVYVGLDSPGKHSPRHAEATYSCARHLIDGNTRELPHFNTNPPPVLRILIAASRGRADALGTRMRDFPGDLATDLWFRVEELTRHSADLEPDERSHASDLMLRLGYPAVAAKILGIHDADPGTHVFSQGSAIAELGVLRRLRHEKRLLESRALSVARDPRFSARVRSVMACSVVVGNGRRGSDTPEAHEATELALKAMRESESETFASHLARQTVYRAVAFIPFLRGDVNRTLALLDQALEHQTAAVPQNDLQRLAWIDHAFPLYETITKTHLALGHTDRAVTASKRLTELSPNDHRAWDARGQALFRAGHLDEAIDAYGRVVALGGLPVAKASYQLGWIHGQLGDRGKARSYYQLSQKVDPTVSILRELVEETNA